MTSGHSRYLSRANSSDSLNIYICCSRAASSSETLVTFGFASDDSEFYLKLPAESEIAECVQLC